MLITNRVRYGCGPTTGQPRFGSSLPQKTPLAKESIRAFSINRMLSSPRRSSGMCCRV